MTPLRSLPCLLLTAHLAAQVLVVDPTGDGHSRTIQGAVDMAGNGAVILVRAATYDEAVTIRGKALTLLGEAGARVASPFGNQITIANHPAGGVTRIARLRLGQDYTFVPGVLGVDVTGGSGTLHLDELLLTRPLRVRGFGGALTMSRCMVRPSIVSFGGTEIPLPGIDLRDIAPSVLSDCDIEGGKGLPDRDNPGPGMPALLATKSTLELVRPRFQGGLGGQFLRSFGAVIEGDSGNGIELNAATARMHGAPGSFVRGRTPESFQFRIPAGGTGIVLNGSRLEHGAVVVAGGGGQLPGPAFRADPTSVRVPVTRPVPTLGRDGGYRIGQRTVLDVYGDAGAPGAFVITTHMIWAPLPFGPLFVDPSMIGFSLGFTLDSSGAFRHPLALPFDVATIGSVFVAQPATLDPSLRLTLGGPDIGVVTW